jgi:PKHD-type hydroxylase
MSILLENALDADDLARIRSLIASEDFVDGRGTSTLVGKNNTQLPPDSPIAREAGALILERLADNETFQMRALPRRILAPLFSRYEVGMTYPEHVDTAVMNDCRTDLAMTIFLSDLASYGGGELVVDTGNGERRYRLAAGDAVVYPASTLHSVSPVTFGVRIAAVTWMQSLIRDPLRREVLYDLGSAASGLADTSYGARLRCSYQNLLRLWGEV